MNCLKRADLTTKLARLAGYSTASGFKRAMLGNVDEADQMIDVVAEFVELWEPRSETIAQIGLLGDESSRLKFVKWVSADLPELAEGKTYRFQNVVTDEYQGRYSVSLPRRPSSRSGRGTRQESSVGTVSPGPSTVHE